VLRYLRRKKIVCRFAREQDMRPVLALGISRASLETIWPALLNLPADRVMVSLSQYSDVCEIMNGCLQSSVRPRKRCADLID